MPYMQGIEVLCIAYLYLYSVAKYLWLHMLFYLMYIACIVVKRKKPTHSVEYVV